MPLPFKYRNLKFENESSSKIEVTAAHVEAYLKKNEVLPASILFKIENSKLNESELQTFIEHFSAIS